MCRPSNNFVVSTCIAFSISSPIFLLIWTVGLAPRLITNLWQMKFGSILVTSFTIQANKSRLFFNRLANRLSYSTVSLVPILRFSLLQSCTLFPLLALAAHIWRSDFQRDQRFCYNIHLSLSDPRESPLLSH